MPVAAAAGHQGQIPGGGHETRPGGAASPTRPAPDNAGAEAPGAGENVRVLPE
jgi:hypothetical protein